MMQMLVSIQWWSLPSSQVKGYSIPKSLHFYFMGTSSERGPDCRHTLFTFVHFDIAFRRCNKGGNYQLIRKWMSSRLRSAVVTHSLRNLKVPGSIPPGVPQIFRGLYDLGATYSLSDETLNRGPVYRCFTPSTLKNQVALWNQGLICIRLSFSLLFHGHMGLKA